MSSRDVCAYHTLEAFSCVTPTSGAHRNESGIVNLDDATGPGTHWVAYAKRNNRVVYFDSFGNLRSPKELVRYFGNGAMMIEYNRTSYQTYDQSFCGQMYLRFLQTVDAREFKKLDEICCEILVFVECFFRHVVDAYAEREDHRSRGEFLSRHRFE